MPGTKSVRKDARTFFCPEDAKKRIKLARLLFKDTPASVYSLASGNLSEDRFVIEKHQGDFTNALAALSWMVRFPGTTYRIVQIDTAEQRPVAAAVVKVRGKKLEKEN